MNLVSAIWKQPLDAMTSPDFRLWLNAAQKQKFSRGAATHQHHARIVAHDLRHQLRNFAIRKRARPVRCERRESTVVIQQEHTSRRVSHSIKKGHPNVVLFSYVHAAFSPCEEEGTYPGSEKHYAARRTVNRDCGARNAKPAPLRAELRYGV